MREAQSTISRCDDACERRIAEALRAQWRMIDEVSLRLCPNGDGFEATIRLNQTLVRGALEQQGLNGSRASLELAESRRLAAIAGCVERLNAGLPTRDSIRRFEVVPWSYSTSSTA